MFWGGYGNKRHLKTKVIPIDEKTVKYSIDLTYDSKEVLNECIYSIAKTIADSGMVIRQINCTPKR